jgi:hypothetical protein
MSSRSLVVDLTSSDDAGMGARDWDMETSFGSIDPHDYVEFPSRVSARDAVQAGFFETLLPSNST